jgi:phospholipid transport system substrate-binding protein
MLTRRTFLLAAAALPLLGRAMPTWAASTDQAEAMIQKLLTDLTAVVNGPGSAAAKQASLARLVDASVDVEAVARFCLGRYWRSATPQQQKEFVAQFRRYLMANITGKVGEYQGVTFSMGRAQPREADVAVSTIVTRPGNAPNKVDWIVSTESGAPKIIDVVAEGTSLRLTQRSDYSAFLARNNGNVQALIDAMAKQPSPVT